MTGARDEQAGAAIPSPMGRGARASLGCPEATFIVALLLPVFMFSACSVETSKKSPVRDILLSSTSVGEARAGAAPISWHFDNDGSFAAIALTGVASWSARGTWKETPEGHILLEGITDHATDMGQKGLALRRTLIGVDVVERGGHVIWARFVYADEEGKSGR